MRGEYRIERRHDIVENYRSMEKIDILGKWIVSKRTSLKKREGTWQFNSVIWLACGKKRMRRREWKEKWRTLTVTSSETFLPRRGRRRDRRGSVSRDLRRAADCSPGLWRIIKLAEESLRAPRRGGQLGWLVILSLSVSLRWNYAPLRDLSANGVANFCLPSRRKETEKRRIVPSAFFPFPSFLSFLLPLSFFPS